MPAPALAIPDRDQIGGTAFARAWARLGFPVFPLSTLVKDGKWTKAPALKVPETDDDRAPDTIPGLDRSKGGHHQASTDDGYVHKTWADLRGRALVGSPLPTDVICLDFDKSEDAWLEAHPELVEVYQRQRAATFVVQTQDAERFHIYFRVPSGTRVPARFPGYGPAPPDNIRHFGELKGCWSSEGNKAGYVALPTQRRPDGKGRYHVVNGEPTAPALIDPRLLAHLLDGTPAAMDTPGGGVSLKPSTFVDTSEDWLLTETAGEGEREPRLHAIAWSRDWRSRSEMMAIFDGVNNRLFNPPHARPYIEEIATREWQAYQQRQVHQPSEETTAQNCAVVGEQQEEEKPKAQEEDASKDDQLWRAARVRVRRNTRIRMDELRGPDGVWRVADPAMRRPPPPVACPSPCPLSAWDGRGLGRAAIQMLLSCRAEEFASDPVADDVRGTAPRLRTGSAGGRRARGGGVGGDAGMPAGDRRSARPPRRRRRRVGRRVDRTSCWHLIRALVGGRALPGRGLMSGTRSSGQPSSS